MTMAMNFSAALPWSPGEETMHRLLNVPERDNPTMPMLTPHASLMLQRAPLLAFGAVDSHNRPWTTLWGGSPGIAESLGGSYIGIRAIVDAQNDPAVHALNLRPNKRGRDGVQLQTDGKRIAALAIDLMGRRRAKLGGKIVAGTIEPLHSHNNQTDNVAARSQIQLVVKVDHSLGNCPKYLNQYEISPTVVPPSSVSVEATLSEDMKHLIAKSDMFFITAPSELSTSTNYRGGPPGFVRVDSSQSIVYPEYSGNRLYQSLGNVQMNPRVGIAFPDLESGDVLYVTGSARVIVNKEAAVLMPGSNLVVKINVEEARFAIGGLAFRGIRKMPSPYNPRVRTLNSEGSAKSAFARTPHSHAQCARLIQRSYITASIARFTFSVAKGLDYEPGQWIALDFKQELDRGYSHMREDDPTSLNDDFIRTFTITSRPINKDRGELEFEITIRKVGPVTQHLFKQNGHANFEIPILGIGGGFKISQNQGSTVTFVAGGIGITPLLSQLDDIHLDPADFGLLWAIGSDDMDLAIATLQMFPKLGSCTSIFISCHKLSKSIDQLTAALERLGATIFHHRIEQSDVASRFSDHWYLCAGTSLTKDMSQWLQGQHLTTESFAY